MENLEKCLKYQRELDTIDSQYEALATREARGAIFIFLLTGWIYAGYIKYLLWKPLILIFFPGIFIASFATALTFIPLFQIKKSMLKSCSKGKRYSAVTFFISIILYILNMANPFICAVYYVKLIFKYI